MLLYIRECADLNSSNICKFVEATLPSTIGQLCPTCLNCYFRARYTAHRRPAPFTRQQCKYVNPQNDGRVPSPVHIWGGPSRVESKNSETEKSVYRVHLSKFSK